MGCTFPEVKAGLFIHYLKKKRDEACVHAIVSTIYQCKEISYLTTLYLPPVLFKKPVKPGRVSFDRSYTCSFKIETDLCLLPIRDTFLF
jgi:hypothetical protein